jgi:hypothetical protein
MEKPLAVFEEVREIFRLMFPRQTFSAVRRAFDDVSGLFAGNYPGYRGCNTQFHDLKHTTDCLLAMARLIHGAHITESLFTPHLTRLALIASLLHDTGYVQLEDEREGTGARYTQVHVQRSIRFMERYLAANGYSGEDYRICRQCLECTGLDVRIDRIPFADESEALLGYMLGTADLLGQMADRTYLEKLLFLFREFEEAGIPGFASEEELLRKTGGFYEITKKRLAVELKNARRFMRPHFAVRWGIDRNLYSEAIEANIQFLAHLMEHHPRDYRAYLRRSGFVQAIERFEQPGE